MYLTLLNVVFSFRRKTKLDEDDEDDEDEEEET